MNAWQDWQKILFGIFCGLIAAGLILLLASQPHGAGIVLAPAPTQSDIQVYVAGAVLAPGVYQLPPGSRAQQAVEAAGGLTANADVNAINLAVQLTDGAKILIPEIGNALPSSSRAGGITGILINLNTATQEELMTLPGIGEEKALLIIHYREENGPFKTIDEIQNVKGIGPAIYETLKNLITVAP